MSCIDWLAIIGISWGVLSIIAGILIGRRLKKIRRGMFDGQ